MSDQPHDPAHPLHKRRPRYRGKHPRRFEERYKEQAPERYPEMQGHIRAQGRTPAGSHVPIMVAEVMEALEPKPEEVVADCTLGYGGHAAEFMKRIGPAGRLVGFDLDRTQLDRTRARLEPLGVPMGVHHMNYAGIAKAMTLEKLEGFDIIFADLGVSSMQIDDPARGFSYKVDGPLDMRMDGRIPKTAAHLLAELSPRELSEALEELGDEPDHDPIARRIAEERRQQPITETQHLVRLIFEAKGLSVQDWRRRREQGGRELHPAALTFQALRILVNDELGSLTELLRLAPYCLRPGGRIGILTFHSGEDRLVKHAFRDGHCNGTYSALSPDPIRPSPQEIHSNPRSVPAKLRWARVGTES